MMKLRRFGGLKYLAAITSCMGILSGAFFTGYGYGAMPADRRHGGIDSDDNGKEVHIVLENSTNSDFEKKSHTTFQVSYK